MGRRTFSWSFLFGGCARVDDIPSPESSPPPPPRKLVKQSSYTRVSCSDIGSATTPEELSSLSSSLLGANLHVFTMAEMTAATQGFSAGNFIGKGGFGPVYKGHINNNLRPGLKAQMVAVKKLDLKGMQGHKEWLTEVILLGQLRHPHLVKLIGYCYEDDNRLLVYEFMAHGSLENHLFNKYLVSLPWENRIKIAVGAARGLEFLHGVDQPVIYRDFKASNILLDSEFKAKLSDFGLAKDGPQGDDTHVSTRIMGTHGYAAPEYIMTGHLTAKSDVYSFGVVLLELITGRPSMDKSRPNREKSLVDWAKPLLNDPRKLNRIIDPGLEGRYSLKGVQKAAALAYHCLSHLPKSRPTMSMVVEILEPILEYNDIPIGAFVFTVKDETKKVEKVNVKEDQVDNVAKHPDNDEAENTLETKANKHINDLLDQNQSHKHQQRRKKTENKTHRHHRRRHDDCKQRHSATQHVRYTDSALYTKPSKRQHNRDL